MAPPFLTLDRVEIGFGGRPLILDATLSLGSGERLALVGRNGSGKSTLMRVLAGQAEPDRGTRFLQPGTRVALLAQEPSLAGHATVGDYVAAALDDPAQRYRADAALDELDLSPGRATDALSGGEARRAALARALVGEPELLLLDEPTNHLDVPSIEALEARLSAWRGAVMAISHDRRFLEHMARAVLWLDRGVLRRLDQPFARFESWQETVMAEEAEQQHKLDRLIQAETAWSREGISARRKRNQGRLARLHELRATRAGQLAAPGTAAIAASAGANGAKLAIEAKGIAKSFAGRAIIQPFGTRILRGDRIGIVGRNGAGKTTLLRMLLGQLEPDAGTVRRATGLEPTYLDQHRDRLVPGRSVQDTLTDGRGDRIDVLGKVMHVAGYAKRFGFEARQLATPVDALSGGERNRLLLARALAEPTDLLVLDEPTNDLDMETLDQLEEALDGYTGTLLAVSHDRDFLDRVATAILAVEPGGRVVEYAGGWSDYERQRGDVAAAADKAPPTRAKPAAREATRPASARLSYQEQRALDGLPAEIARLEAEAARLEALLADPGLYARDRAAFEAAAVGFEAAHTARATAEERWLELEMKREALDKGGAVGR